MNETDRYPINPRTEPPSYTLIRRGMYACAAFVLLAITILSAEFAHVRRVPWTPELAQVHAAYMAPTPEAASWRARHPWDAENIPGCPPGCTCVCYQGHCSPVCGEPQPK